MKTLFLAWQDPVRRGWYPIGRLTFDGQYYSFAYLRGAEEARRQSGFSPLTSFPELGTVYDSDALFPLFANRVLPASRPDYDDYVEWLNVPQNGDDPIALLMRSGGRRATDSLEVFPCPEPDEEGAYHIHFFVHGLSHFPEASLARIERLNQGEPLLMAWDFQNPCDPQAILLRTNDAYEGDRHLVGFCPRYLLHDAFEVLQKCTVPPEVKVERVNAPPAPLQLRLLCSLTANWPEGFRPCSGPMYQPLVPETASPPVAV